MWRIALVIAIVLIVDFLLFFVGWFGSVDMNMVEIARTLQTQTENPSAENKRVFDAAWEKGQIQQFKVRTGFSIMILVVTAGGFFVAGRQFERRRTANRTFDARK